MHSSAAAAAANRERKNAEDGKLHTRKQMTALKKGPKISQYNTTVGLET